VSFAPPFRIEGPETFYRFGTAALTAQGALIVVSLLLFYRSRSHGWPYLVVAGFAVCNGLIARQLDARGWMLSVTELVASLNPSVTFILAFLIMFASVWFAKSKGSVSTALEIKTQGKRN
jgi:hypothetical protein